MRVRISVRIWPLKSFLLIVTEYFWHLCQILISWSGFTWASLPYAGLQAQRIPATAVERPSAGLQRVSGWLSGPRPFHAGLHLETRPVLCKWEGSQLSRGHDGQQAASDIPERKCPLQHQVMALWKMTNAAIWGWIRHLEVPHFHFWLHVSSTSI